MVLVLSIAHGASTLTLGVSPKPPVTVTLSKLFDALIGFGFGVDVGVGEADELAGVFAGLPQVFAYFPEDGPPRLAEYQAQRQQFATTTEALNMRASDHVRLKLKPEAAHRADALQQMLAAIRSSA